MSNGTDKFEHAITLASNLNDLLSNLKQLGEQGYHVVGILPLMKDEHGQHATGILCERLRRAIEIAPTDFKLG